MSVFIEARTEPFEERRNDMTNQMRNSGRPTQPVRRPLRGVQLKEDTFATIRIMGSDGEFMPVIDAAGETYVESDGMNFTTHYTNFFVQQVSEERHEKQQIVETFGESFIFFFGEAPRLLNVQGLLLNTADFNWRSEFWANYERYFRGTRLVELGARLYLIYDDRIVEGYMIGANANENSNAQEVLPFSFRMFVTGQTDISLLGDPNYPVPPGDIDYTELSSYEEALRMWESNRNLQRELSTKAVADANRTSYLGSGAFLRGAIRRNIISAGDPSISSFLMRAMQAVQIAQTISSATNSFAPTENMSLSQDRSTPLRGTFQDNQDEFIGSNSDQPTAQELAAPLSMADRWLEADRKIDNGLTGMISGFASTAVNMWDMMGRSGRAVQQIRENGGNRNRSNTIQRGLTVGDNSEPRPPVLARDVPFGMCISEGDFF